MTLTRHDTEGHLFVPVNVLALPAGVASDVLGRDVPDDQRAPCVQAQAGALSKPSLHLSFLNHE